MFEDLKIPQELVPSDPRFACGPSLIPVEYLEALAETGKHLLGTSHRKSAVKNLVKEVQEGLKSYFSLPTDYQVLIGTGGATLLFDMISLGMVEKKSAHFTCGEFSSKWFKAAKNVPWIEAQELTVDYGQGITPGPVAGADTLCMTLNETSTGVQIDTFDKLKGTDALIAVDATSGAGQVPCDLKGIDLFFFSPQKVFASEGGTWIAILSPKALTRLEQVASEAKEKKRYIPIIMSWKHALENSLKNQTYNTPAVSTLFYLNEQVKRMVKQGYKQVVKEAQEKANLVYGWAESKDYLSPYVQEAKYRSIAVATIDVDEKVPVIELLKVLRQQKVVYDIDAYRKLGRNQFRIALFHNIAYQDLKKLTELLSFAIEREL